jgi:tetratricopeptide (TPR) repeat protein
MPANPGQRRSSEKAKKKRAAAQHQRKARNAAMKAREASRPAEAEQEAPDGAAPHPFATEEVDFDALDEANAEIATLIKKKKLDDAEKKARELSTKYPRLSDGLQRLAEVHEKRGEKDKAIAALKEAQKRPNDGDEEAAEEIAASLKRLGA